MAFSTDGPKSARCGATNPLSLKCHTVKDMKGSASYWKRRQSVQNAIAVRRRASKTTAKWRKELKRSADISAKQLHRNTHLSILLLAL